MKDNIVVTKARRGIIWIGKYAPFFIVAIATLSNVESYLSMEFGIYAQYDDYVVCYKPISWWIAKYFEFNLGCVTTLLILSIGVEACIWNRASVAYLAIMLYQKDYFINNTISEQAFKFILIANSLLGCFLVYKGIFIFVKSKHLWKK